MQTTEPLQQPPKLAECNPFYITNNKLYGTQWQSADNQGFDTMKSADIPLYRATVSAPPK